MYGRVVNTLFSADNINEALAPLLLISKIFGMYSRPLQLGTNPKKNVAGIFWSVGITFFFMTLSVYSICETTYSFANLIADVGDSTVLYMGLLTYLVLIAVSTIMNKQVVGILRGLAKFDNNMKHLDPALKLEKVYKRTKISLATGIGGLLVLLSIHLWAEGFLYVNRITLVVIGAEVIAYSVPIITTLITVIQFSTIVLLLKQRFTWINLKLVQTQKNWSAWHMAVNTSFFPLYKIESDATLKTKPLPPERVIEILEALRKKHYQLCALSADVNKVYSFPILLITLQIFITIILTIFFYFYETSYAKARSHFLFAAYTIWITCVNFGELLLMVIACSKTATKAKLTGALLNNFKNTTRELEDFVAHFSCQLLHHDIIFTGFGIFTLDETLVFSIVAAITTYLVIVIQFQSGFTN